jgi:hypothetical protein
VFPDRRRLLIFGIGGVVLVAVAWLSIHRGLDLLYTDQAVNNSPTLQTRSVIPAAIAGVMRSDL